MSLTEIAELHNTNKRFDCWRCMWRRMTTGWNLQADESFWIYRFVCPGVSPKLYFFEVDLYLPINCARNLLICQNSPDQAGQNDIEVREGRSPGFVVLVSRSEAMSLLVFVALYTDANHPMIEKKELLNLLQITLEIPQSFGLHWSWIPAVRYSRQAWLLRPGKSYIFDPSKLWSKKYRRICRWCKLFCAKTGCNR